MAFSTGSESFQNSFGIDFETSLNQSKFQNPCPLNFYESEEISESISELDLNQNQNPNFFSVETDKKLSFVYFTLFDYVLEQNANKSSLGHKSESNDKT